MRKYEVAHLTTDDQIVETSHLAPASTVFEDSFAAIGRGAIFQTTNGHHAVEDLLPGDMVITDSHGPQRLLWKGTMVLVPGSRNTRPEMATMTRVTADALGMGRPAPDLVLGPAARLVHTAPGIDTLTGAPKALVPVRDFIDQTQIIELTPIAPVRCYQLGFANHCILNANGIQIESLHPGPAHALGLRNDMLALLMSLFPHKSEISDFGPMLLPRINIRDLDLFAAA